MPIYKCRGAASGEGGRPAPVSGRESVPRQHETTIASSEKQIEQESSLKPLKTRRRRSNGRASRTRAINARAAVPQARTVRGGVRGARTIIWWIDEASERGCFGERARTSVADRRAVATVQEATCYVDELESALRLHACAAPSASCVIVCPSCVQHGVRVGR